MMQSVKVSNTSVSLLTYDKNKKVQLVLATFYENRDFLWVLSILIIIIIFIKEIVTFNHKLMTLTYKSQTSMYLLPNFNIYI